MLASLLAPHRLPEQGRPRRSYAQRELAPGQSCVLADIEGSGCIRHIFFTMPPAFLRTSVLRFWWDDEEHPSVECPASEFFGVGHHYTSLPFSSPVFYVAERYGFNCYAPMPFSRRARIELSNESDKTAAGIFCYASFDSYAADHGIPWRFHAVWRREMPALRRGAPFVLLEAKGSGRLIGVIYHLCRRDPDDRWTHGGADQFFIDGDTPEPGYIYGVGGEDFAHQAWGLYPSEGPYSGAHLVHPRPDIKPAEGPVPFEPHGFEQHDGGRYSLYRFFIPDPIVFKSSLRFEFGSNANEISATTYWYQGEPHAAFCGIPAPKQRYLGTRLAREECLRPLELGLDIPVAVLGPALFTKKPPFDPTRGVDLAARLATDVRQPYGDVVRPPYNITWRRSVVRAGFLDLAAIHRPKCRLAERGLWNYRNLPVPIMSFQLVRFSVKKASRLILRFGIEDRVFVWLNGSDLGTLEVADPCPWECRDLPLDLKAGRHDLIFAATQERLCRWSAWNLYFAFLDARGQLAKGLEFADFAELDATPELWREPWPPEAPIQSDHPRDPLHMR